MEKPQKHWIVCCWGEGPTTFPTFEDAEVYATEQAEESAGLEIFIYEAVGYRIVPLGKCKYIQL